MKIMMLCLSPDLGGLELYAYDTAWHLQQQGHEVCSVLNTQGRLKDHVRAKGKLSPTLVRAPRTVFGKMRLARKLLRIVQQQHIQLVHIHWNRDLLLAVLLKRLVARAVPEHQIRLVYSRHMQITRAKHDVYHAFLYRHVDCLLTSTKQMQREAATFLPLPVSRIRLLPLGCKKYDGPDDPALLEGTACEKAGFKIGLFGRIEQGKGQHLMLDALVRLRAKNVPVCCLIVGHVMDKDYYTSLQRSLSRHDLDDCVSFMGFVDKPQQLMRHFDVVVSTTFHETFGLVLIEAMRQGICVIGADAGGVQEIIDPGETGLRFAPRDANDLADKLYYIYSHPCNIW